MDSTTMRLYYIIGKHYIPISYIRKSSVRQVPLSNLAFIKVKLEDHNPETFNNNDVHLCCEYKKDNNSV